MCGAADAYSLCPFDQAKATAEGGCATPISHTGGTPVPTLKRYSKKIAGHFGPRSILQFFAVSFP